MKYYYKLINNETNEIESYVESSRCTRPENLCNILGLSGYHAVSCTKQEYEEQNKNMRKMHMMKIPELKIKPCPFCGFDAEVVKVTYPTGRQGYEIKCMHEYKCYLFCATETAYWDSAEDAVRAWNQREESE